MKISRLKTAAWALAALAGGVICANAQGSGALTANILFSNAPVWEVFGVPQLNVTFNGADISIVDYDVDTDGSGKITGFATVIVETDTGTANLVVTVSGNITTKNGAASVKINLNGKGATLTDTSAGKATLSMSFTGTPDTESGQIVGTANATFKSGISGQSTLKLNGATAHIDSGDVETSDQLPVNAQIVSFKGSLNTAGRMIVGFGSQLPFTGTGSTGSKLNFNLNLKGVEWGKGSNLTIKGNVEDVFDSSTWSELTANGKVEGQKVSTTVFAVDVTPGWD